MFDPYRKWLGILPKDQPPNHYRLLSLELFEADLDVIEGAADQRMGFVRQYQSGEYAADAARILNELATARLCLLKPSTKAAYDEKLRKQLAAKDFDAGFLDLPLTDLAEAAAPKGPQKDATVARFQLRDFSVARRDWRSHSDHLRRVGFHCDTRHKAKRTSEAGSGADGFGGGSEAGEAGCRTAGLSSSRRVCRLGSREGVETGGRIDRPGADPGHPTRWS